jgi:uncharacterized membrane protein
MNMMNRFLLALRHRWLDASDVKALLPRPLVDQLENQVADSEVRHLGEVRICIEAGLPVSYLWRHIRTNQSIATLVRERALMTFSKLSMWDTQHNNGVLIYLLLAEHRIEIVADRGLNDKVSPEHWRQVVDRLATTLQEKRVHEGLQMALHEVSELLAQHFPHDHAVMPTNLDELPNALVIL